MRILTKCLAIVVFGIGLFLAGALVSAHRAWFLPVAMVKIENRSGQVLKALDITYESGSAHGSATLPALASDETVRFIFYIRGEGGYRVSAVLGDGTVPKEGGGYVEPGYRETKIITKSGIINSSSYQSGSQ